MRSVVVVRSAARAVVARVSAAPAHAQAPAAAAGHRRHPHRPAPAPQPPAAFPQDAKIAIVNLQQIAQLSADGKSSTAKVQALIAQEAGRGGGEGQAAAGQSEPSCSRAVRC